MQGFFFSQPSLTIMKFSSALMAHNSDVLYLLSVVGGLLVSLTAGGSCMDVAVRTARDPNNLLRLSNALIGFIGFGYQKHLGNSLVKGKLKKLYVTESLYSVLVMTGISLLDPHDLSMLWGFLIFPEKQTNLKSTTANWISPQRRRTIFIFLRGGNSKLILILIVRGSGNKLRSYRSTGKIQWLMEFIRRVAPRGDVIYLLLGGQNGQTRAGLKKSENYPTCFTLGLSALSAVLLWTFLPHITVCILICLCWNVHKSIH
ncbi:uncharacterized protein LOC121639377 [Melanotaenia boesemani]|uniref:uncharacterized protein LOC121639377 n=1 Tax=Melanotaenia boesemani TaxID=1250792 RepID=UPI001C03CC53|nr:uncharacterized protein LOC121639377 [Melanotaenia boesemani]